VDEDEIVKSARLEETHWWYAERRALIRRMLADVPVGRAIDVGCGSGGNTAVLRQLGWDVTGLEYHPAAARLASERGLKVVRADARRMPIRDETMDLVISTDMWEHIDDDRAVADETVRMLRTGGRALVAVPCSMSLWSGHDVALGHVRRYERDELVALMESAGLAVQAVRSWNVLLRPIARIRRRGNESTSEMEHVNPILNAGLRGVVATERWLPLHRLPGISLVVTATKR
jgi:SAM-dependent methyltransferase